MSDTRSTDRKSPDSVVVTGAAGWLGQNLVRAVADRSEVRCLVRDEHESRLLQLVSPTIQTVVGDVRDPVALDQLFAGSKGSSVFHTAAVIHPTEGTRELFDVNVGGTEMVIDRAKRAQVSRFVHVSSNSPFGANGSATDRFTEASPYNPYLAYGASKLEAEAIVDRTAAQGDLETVIVRPPWFYGPFQPERQTTWLAAVRRGRFPLIGDGTNRRSMVFTGNLVHGLLRAEIAAAAPGQSYWIADPEPYDMRTVLSTVREALAAEGFAVSGGQPRLPRIVGAMAERGDRIVQGRGRYVQALHVLGELKDTIACDVSKAMTEISYEPVTTLFDGMRESIRWSVARGHRL
ncbi:MAG: NAD-dependent epimerase/dehydratase family protein [Acidimicrobiales bacterium]